jgi:hypothetical protein
MGSIINWWHLLIKNNENVNSGIIGVVDHESDVEPDNIYCLNIELKC